MTNIDVTAILEDAEKSDNKEQAKHASTEPTTKSDAANQQSQGNGSGHARRNDDREQKRRDSSHERRVNSGNRRTRSRSPVVDRRSSHRDRYRERDDDRRDRGGRRSSGDRYRPDGHHSSDDDRYYRPSGRDRRERDRPRERRRRHSRSPRNSPKLTDDERDQRTVFVQQLAARLETRHLIAFFDKVGKVKEAQIVRDRVTGRSKGYVTPPLLATLTFADLYSVGYVEFVDKSSVPAALQLTGQSLKGVPIIVQLTEAEKNRQARTTENSNGNAAAPFHRLYVGNIHFSLTEDDIRQIFETFGPLEAASLTRDENGRSRGYGFVQYENADSAKEALEKMQGFELAGRAIRVGLGNDRSHEAAMQRVGPQNQASAFSGAGGRGVHAGGTNNFDRTGPRQNEKISGASALDDTEIAGVNFNNISRHSLMDKLARRTETKDKNGTGDKAKPTTSQPTPPQVQPTASQTQISRCIVVHNAFDLRAYVLPHLTNYYDHRLTARSREEAADPTGAWIQKLQEEFKEEFDKTYGRTVHIGVDPNSLQGNVYVKFIDAESGKKAKLGLNGRHFARRMVSANYLVEPVYDAMYPEARNL